MTGELSNRGVLIESNWHELNTEIEILCEKLNTHKTKIIAVTKTRSIEEIQIAYDIGIRDFGENYAQEFESKSKMLPQANWHFIGHLQRGNAKKIIPFCTMLHTVDSIKLANRLANLSFSGKLLLQVKLGQELTKSGIELNFIKVKQIYEQIKSLGLDVKGLMAIGSLEWSREKTLSQYRRLYNMGKDLGLPELSLGMSDDYPIAIEAGSTMIRIGTRIFGPRV